MAQEGPKRDPRGLQEGFKRGPERVPKGDSHPTWLRDPSRTFPGPSRTPPGSDFETNVGLQNRPQEGKIVSKTSLSKEGAIEAADKEGVFKTRANSDRALNRTRFDNGFRKAPNRSFAETHSQSCISTATVKESM